LREFFAQTEPHQCSIITVVVVAAAAAVQMFLVLPKEQENINTPILQAKRFSPPICRPQSLPGWITVHIVRSLCSLH